MYSKIGRLGRPNQPGFTIVEIIIVLALSSVFMIILFLLFSQAQTHRRDEQRKEYLREVAQNIAKFKDSANNQYQYPTAAQFTSQFAPPGAYEVLAGDVDPSKNVVYSFTAPPSPQPSSTSDLGTIFYNPGVSCTGVSGVGYFSLVTYLEADIPFCLDSV